MYKEVFRSGGYLSVWNKSNLYMIVLVFAYTAHDCSLPTNWEEIPKFFILFPTNCHTRNVSRIWISPSYMRGTNKAIGGLGTKHNTSRLIAATVNPRESLFKFQLLCYKYDAKKLYRIEHWFTTTLFLKKTQNNTQDIWQN